MNRVIPKAWPARLAMVLLLLPFGPGVAAAATPTLNKSQTAVLLGAMNRADEKSIEKLPGMTPGAASKVVAFRQGGKTFTSIDQVREVSGLDAAAFAKTMAFYGRYDFSLEDADAAGGAEKVKPPTAGNRSRRASIGEPRKPDAPPAAGQTAPPAEGGLKLDLDVRSSYYSVLPGFDLEKVDQERKKVFLDTINKELCSCGCSGETLGYCLVNDPGCPVVKARVTKIYKDVFGSAPVAPGGSGASH